MSEMRTSIHDLPNGGITVRCEQDLSYLVDEYAERIQRNVDAAALDKAAGVLAGFGYVKVVRCRDCRHYMDYEHEYEPNLGYCREHDREEVRDSWFCAWGERKVDAQPERLRGEGE